jgi:ethanolaminephosphotransferase
MDKTQLMLSNALQILNIIKATFPSFDTKKPCPEEPTDIEKLACLWERVWKTKPDTGSGDMYVDTWLQAVSGVWTRPTT